jgi:hypothetical protein
MTVIATNYLLSM